ncbi:MAG: hypothetical protein IIX54_01415 [Clostridia bacterium]|nr:hypothetical protein [Clostridia bacterium]
MVKGVNKQIIEINDTGNKYFEKVLLFVAPGKKDMPPELLNTRAKEYVIEFSNSISPSISLRERITRKKAKKRAILISVSAITVAVITALIINFL